MKISDARKREIRHAEIDRAVREVCGALGIKPALLDDTTRSMLIGALAMYALETRKTWERRDSHQRFLALMDKYDDEEHGLPSKLRRLIDHPATSAEERAAAERALIRIGAA